MLFYCVFVQGLNEEINPRAAELEESNALALAIIQPGNRYRDITEILNMLWIESSF